MNALRSETSTIPVWLLPNLLSLDAPLVAVTWQWMLARSLHVNIPGTVTLALAVCVWAIYVVDRVLDGPGSLTARHLFAARHRALLLLSVGVVLFAASVVLLPQLPQRIVVLGCSVAACCGAYLLAVQGRFRRSSSKGIAMSLLYAAGIVLPAWNWFAFFAAAFTAWMNTRLIDAWEDGHRPALDLRLLVGAAGLFFAAAGGRFGLGAAVGCWLMLAVDAAGSRMTLDAIRCLFDWALVLGALFVIGTT